MKYLTSTALEWVIRFILWIYHKLGLFGILILLFLIEIPILYYGFTSVSEEYRFADNYTFTRITSITPIETTDQKLLANHIIPEPDHVYYLVLLQIENNYSDELDYFSALAKDQQGHPLDLTRMNYYDGTQSPFLYKDAVLPAGTSCEIPLILTVTEEEQRTLKKLTIYENEYHHDKATETNKITTTFPKSP